MAIIGGAVNLPQVATPGTPATGENKIYFKADRRLYSKDESGSELLVASAQAGAFQPTDQGLKAWTCDTLLSYNGPNAVTAGVVYLNAFWLPSAATITNMIVFINTTAGVGVANGFLGIYSAAGSKLIATAAQTTGMQALGIHTLALTAPTALSAGRYYAALLIGSATTLPIFSRSGTTIVNDSLLNAGATAALANFRCGTVLTGQTSLPASLTMANVSLVGTGGSSANFWCGFS